ncbi:hypothetical protein AeMF1_013647 [Aphanomyces euteiches]|nr:hypothetical protein AeMF1_013647 [Aphanomyces euteiches]
MASSNADAMQGELRGRPDGLEKSPLEAVAAAAASVSSALHKLEPRLHVPRHLDLFSHAIHNYVDEMEADSIAHDVVAGQDHRIHHPLPLASLDSFVVFPTSTTTMSTVNALLDDALLHLSSVDASAMSLETKYHDIWQDIDRDRMARDRQRLQQRFRQWKQTTHLHKLVRGKSLRGHFRRVARCFDRWRVRTTQRRRATVKFTIAMQSHQARVFSAWRLACQRRHDAGRLRKDALARHLKAHFTSWRRFARCSRGLRGLVSARHFASVESTFREWKAMVPVQKRQRQAIHLLQKTVSAALSIRGLRSWRAAVVLWRAEELRRREELKRQRAIKASVLRAWKRRVHVNQTSDGHLKRVKRRWLAQSFQSWRHHWLDAKSHQPTTWPPEIVGLWLVALFQLPQEAAAGCNVHGHELLSLPSILAQTRQPLNPLLERLLPKMPLFFCSMDHRVKLLDAIASLKKSTATRLSKDMFMQQRLAKLATVTDYASLRQFCAQDRDLVLYVRQLDTMRVDQFLALGPEALASAMQCHREDLVELFLTAQNQLRMAAGSGAVRRAAGDDALVHSRSDGSGWNVAAWLESMRLSQYEGTFRRHGMTSIEAVRHLSHDILRHELQVQSKLHRDRILQFAAQFTHAAPAAFRLRLALAHVDDVPKAASPTQRKQQRQQPAMLQKQVRTLFFAVCRWLENEPSPASLERLYLSMQSNSEGRHVSKASFAHAIRAMNIGLTSAHVHSMWQAMTTIGHVNYTEFMHFFIDLFQQRRAMLELAIQTLEDYKNKPDYTDQLQQLMHALARAGEILIAAGVGV